MTTASRFGSAAPGAEPPALSPLPTAEPERRRRRWPWIVLLVALVAAGCVLGTRWALDRHEVIAWQVVEPIAAGERISTAQLEQVRVDQAEDASVTALSDSAPRGFARTDLPAGTILTPESVTTGPAGPPEGVGLVGLALTPGQAPAGELTAGDPVRLLHVPPPPGTGQAPRATSVLLPSATVWSATTTQQGGVVVSVRVPLEQAERIGGLAARNEVAVVRLSVDQPPSTATAAKPAPRSRTRGADGNRGPGPAERARPRDNQRRDRPAQDGPRPRRNRG